MRGKRQKLTQAAQAKLPLVEPPRKRPLLLWAPFYDGDPNDVAHGFPGFAMRQVWEKDASYVYPRGRFGVELVDDPEVMAQYAHDDRPLATHFRLRWEVVPIRVERARHMNDGAVGSLRFRCEITGALWLAIKQASGYANALELVADERLTDYDVNDADHGVVKGAQIRLGRRTWAK